MPRRANREPPAPSLRLLGDVELSRGGVRLPLPPSRKTRALLAYLAVTGRAHRRDRLCSLLWDVADDPRGALRWSLAKLRPLVDDPQHARLVAEGDAVRLDASGLKVDVLELRRAVETGLDALDTDRLEALAASLGGVFLEGLELTEFRDFHAWCVAERESVRSQHAAVLRVLIERLAGDPDAAIPHARTLVEVAPLDEAARATLVGLLGAAGRRQEAQQQFDLGTRTLDEHGVHRSGALSSAWHRVRGPSPGAPAPDPPAPRTAPVESFRVPRTQYARRGDVSLAYQVVGEGPNLVLIPGWVSHIEYAWEVPGYADFLRRLTSFSRLILVDRRGTGLSDPVAALPTLEERADDVRAVMDAADTERAAIFGISEGGPMSMLLAATHPERVAALVLYGTFARGTATADYPWRYTPKEVEVALDMIQAHWGTGRVARVLAPSLKSDPGLLEAWGRFERLSVSPGQARTLFRMVLDIDVRHVLPAIHTPTLMLQRSGDRTTTPPNGRYIAEHIPGARYVELPGKDHFPWLGDYHTMLDEVQEFLTGVRPAPEPERILATVLFLDIVGSTARLAELGDRAWGDLLARYRTLVRAELTRYRGLEIGTAGDSFLATFDGPARAIRCACAISDAMGGLGIAVRAGLHTGECEVAGGDVHGLAVHIGARVAAAADPDEVLVSSTVKDLVAGAGIRFTSRGGHELAGVPGEWTLFRVDRGR
jgi:pimeloyl-ACP methyl ester carboxylesterase/DNA-binding SARP family transcriptional activator/class 3 adenylate cyclase